MTLTFVALLFPLLALAQWDENKTPTYPELIEIYKKWDLMHSEIELYQMGESDTEFPLYLVILNRAPATYGRARCLHPAGQTRMVRMNMVSGEMPKTSISIATLLRWILKT